MENFKPKSIREERVRKITHLYYSKPEVQKAIFKFSKNREISPRYFEGFGTRPDSLQYLGDVLGFVKNGATSLHCSEELWKDPMNIKTGMTAKESDKLRTGWDLLIDIDCKWFDYSKLAAKAIIQALKQNKVENIGLKFSGSKGWHIIVPYKAFPKQIAGENTKDLFPDLPRKLVAYLGAEAEKIMEQNLPEDFDKQFKDVKIKRGIKCNRCNNIADEFILTDFFCPNCKIGEQRKLPKENIKEFKCPSCRKKFEVKKSIPYSECNQCQINSGTNPDNFSKSIQEDLFELMGLDIALVSPRHLFRMPYSLHEKTALSSVVIDPKEIDGFEFKDANALNVKVKNFMPDSDENEAKEFVMRALDWYSLNKPKQSIQKTTGKFANYAKIKLENLKDENFPPCIKKILEGISDGKKRAVFVLINLFRSIGLEKIELEKRIYEWNEKNEVPLKKGYIISQLNWSYRRKPILPQNCKEFYQNLGVCLPDQFCSKLKNPTNYVIRKNLIQNKTETKVKKTKLKKNSKKTKKYL